MSTIEERLKQLNIELPKAAPPVGAYVPAVAANGMVYVSGQIPIRNGEMIYTGKVGRDLDLEKARQAAELCFINVLIAVTTTGVSLDRIRRVVRLMGHVQCVDEFHEQHLVMNAASELCQKVFGEKGVHSRAAFGTNALPLNAAVEVEGIFALE